MRDENVFACTGCSALQRQIIKNRLNAFERGKYLLQNGILHVVFRISQFVRDQIQS